MNLFHDREQENPAPFEANLTWSCKHLMSNNISNKNLNAFKTIEYPDKLEENINLTNPKK